MRKKLNLAIIAIIIVTVISGLLLSEPCYAYYRYDWNRYKCKVTDRKITKYGVSSYAWYSTEIYNVKTCHYGSSVFIDTDEDDPGFVRASWWCDADWYPDDMILYLCYNWTGTNRSGVSCDVSVGTGGVSVGSSVSWSSSSGTFVKTYNCGREFDYQVSPDDSIYGVEVLREQELYSRAKIEKNKHGYEVSNQYKPY